MAWTIPNYTGTIEYPVGSGLYPQAQWDEIEAAIWAAAFAGNGVSSGCAVTQRGAGANQSVDVASGTIVWAGTEVVVSSGNVAASAAHASLPRFDLVVVSSAGTKSITAGTAAAVPVFPAIPANSVVLAALFRRPNDNTIETAEIVDKRITVKSPTSPGAWTTISKAANTSRASTTTLTADPDLKFTMVANGEYRVRAGLFGENVANGGGIKVGNSGPASPVRIALLAKVPNSSTGMESVAKLQNDAYDATGVQMMGASASMLKGVVLYDGVIHNGANAGDFTIDWAQSTSDVDASILLAGSYLEYQRVD